jgi:hypothetical protein
MDKTFAVAGISTLDGTAKVRFAKDMARIKVLEKNGHKNINLVELPKPMTKVAAVEHLMSHAAFKSAEAQAVLKDYASDDAPVKVEKAVKMDKVVDKAAKTVKTPDEVERIRAKNLQTLKNVHAKVKARDAKEAESIDEVVAGLDEDLELEIPALAKRNEIEDYDA